MDSRLKIHDLSRYDNEALPVPRLLERNMMRDMVLSLVLIVESAADTAWQSNERTLQDVENHD